MPPPQLSLYSRDGVLLGVVADVESLVWCAQAKPGESFIVSSEEFGATCVVACMCVCFLDCVVHVSGTLKLCC